ncbi:hypothetical protein C8J57DRAFT_729943 [Mycena rebaudengoi]|nr:hypothetical protein C8J57DRAFT_729943 [Mycena rebaudengoi]
MLCVLFCSAFLWYILLTAATDLYCTYSLTLTAPCNITYGTLCSDYSWIVIFSHSRAAWILLVLRFKLSLPWHKIGGTVKVLCLVPVLQGPTPIDAGSNLLLIFGRRRRGYPPACGVR